MAMAQNATAVTRMMNTVSMFTVVLLYLVNFQAIRSKIVLMCL